MTDEWVETTLGEVASFTIGKTPPRKDARYWTEDLEHPFCTIADMGDDLSVVDPHREGVTREAISEGKAKLVPAGSLLMSFKLTIGRVGFAARDLYPNEAIAWLQVQSPALDEKFLALWLLSQDLTGGSGRAVKGNTLNGESLRAIRVVVPPLAVQRRIVDLIAHLDTHLTNLRAEVAAGLELERRLIEGLLADQVDVEEATLGELGEFIRGRRFVKADYVPEGLGCIHYGQVHTHFGPVATEVLTYLPEEMATRLRFARHGDIVIAATSEDFEGLGKATVWMGEAEVAVHDDCYIYRHDLDPVFAAYVVASPWFQRQKGQFGDGTKVTRISSTDLARIRVPIPKREAQIRIGETLSALSSQNTLLREEMTSLGLIRRSLLSGLMSQTVQIPLDYDAILDRAA